MFENIISIFKKNKRKELLKPNSKDTAKERLHLVLMQDRANVSVDFLDLMRKEIIEVIKKYIDIDEKAMDVRLTTEANEDGTQGAPALYANIPIINIKDEARKLSKTNQENKITIEPPKNNKVDNSEKDKTNEKLKTDKQEEKEDLEKQVTNLKTNSIEKQGNNESKVKNKQKNDNKEELNEKAEINANNQKDDSKPKAETNNSKTNNDEKTEIKTSNENTEISKKDEETQTIKNENKASTHTENEKNNTNS